MKKDQNIAIYFSNSINHINFNASPFTSFFQYFFRKRSHKT
ncbi:hypothetical protein PT2222_180088 [Paraburkholderia tropica]